MDGYSGGKVLDGHQSLIVDNAEAIKTCFGNKVKSVEEILERLEKEISSGNKNEWASKTLSVLKKMSPTSLKVTFKQIQKGRSIESLRNSLRMEFRMVNRFMAGHDFKEGIRAVLVERRDPVWSPAKLEDVTEEMVENYFAPLSDQYELSLEYPSEE